jgi:hypothetical protein
MPDTPLQLEATLISQQQSLQKLACSLLGDEHGAEDLLQETWLASVFRPVSGEASKAEPLLQRVIGNLARNRRRAERSRSHYEKRAARAEALPNMQQAASEREVVRRVIDAFALEAAGRGVLYRGAGAGGFSGVTESLGLGRLPAIPGASWGGCGWGRVERSVSVE